MKKTKIIMSKGTHKRRYNIRHNRALTLSTSFDLCFKYLHKLFNPPIKFFFFFNASGTVK